MTTLTGNGIVSNYNLGFDGAHSLFVINDNVAADYVLKFATPLASGSAASANIKLVNPAHDQFPMTVDAAGNLWVCDFTAKTVAEYNAPFSGSVSGSPSVTLTFISNPGSIAFDTGGNLYVGLSNGTIKRFNMPISSASTAVATYSLGNTDRVFALTLDPAGNLYASDSGIGNLYKFVAPTDGATPAVTDPGSNTGIGGAYQMAFDRAGNLYVADCDGTGKLDVFPLASTSLTNTSTPSPALAVGTDTCLTGVTVF